MSNPWEILFSWWSERKEKKFHLMKYSKIGSQIAEE